MDKLRYHRALYDRAVKFKNSIKDKYEEATSLTFPSDDSYYDISNDNIMSRDGSKAIYDDITIEVSETLANQMELSLTKSGDMWASFGVPNEIDNMDQRKLVDNKNEEIFKHIESSNFQKNISYVFKDLIIGTSVIKIFTLGNGAKKKIVYKHLNLGRVYIIENGLGEVDTTFYKIKNFTIEKVYSMLGLEIPNFSEREREKYYEQEGIPKEFDIIEFAVPSKKKGKWDFYIVDDGFEEVFFKTELSINPYVVVRFNKKGDISAWGVGKAVERLSLLKSIQYFSKLRMRIISNDAKPAYIVKTGSMQEPDISFMPETVSFVPFDTQIEPLFTNVNLNELNVIIEELKSQLKQAFMIDAILETQARNTYKTAQEVTLSNSKFLDKFATYASSIGDELTKELFTRTYDLLVEEKMITRLPKEIETKVVFRNPIILNERSGKVDNIVKLIQVATGIMGQEGMQSELKIDNIIPFLVKNLDASTDIFKTEEDKQQEQQQQQQQQMMQQMGMAQPQAGGPGAIDSSGLGVGAYGQ